MRRPSHSRRSPYGVLLLSAFVCGAPAAAAAGPTAVRSDYEILGRALYAAQPSAVPESGLGWTLDTASWRLRSGRLWLQQPVTGGGIAGVVFEGRGVFEIGIPDPVELRQLRRFLGAPRLATYRRDFSRLVLATSGGEAAAWGSAPAALAPQPLARERLERASRLEALDIPLRLAAALHTPGGRYLRAEMETSEEGWIAYTWDSARPEEIGLEWTAGRTRESWLQLDRPEDRLPGGRPGSRPRPEVELRHAAIEADLTEPGKWSGTVRAALAVETTVRALRSTQLIRFYLEPRAEIDRVETRDGARLTVLRDRPADRLHSSLAYDPMAVLVLPRPLAEGEEASYRFVYRLEMPRYAGGRLWYPLFEPPKGGLADLHTGRLELTLPARYEVRSMGSRSEERREGGRAITVWEVERPARMLTFVFARRALEHPIRLAGLPEVISFGEEAGSDTADAFHDIAADVANSTLFFQTLFDRQLPSERIYASLIKASHGQAFDGYLHLAESTARGDHPGATELFRAHEVAHQWWGHGVGWAGYRDQWLTEAFAEYSAMLFVEATVKNGPQLFRQIVAAYADEVTGAGRRLFSKFARPGLTRQNDRAIDRIGPIGLGFRAATRGAPRAYLSMAYSKGALVLHMLRGTLRSVSGDDRVFFTVLRDFVDRHWQRQATTADLQRAVERHAPADWSWFFDQWVQGSEIPTYLWERGPTVGPDDQGRYRVELEVEQRGVSPGFRMLVPIRFELPGGRVGEISVMVDEAAERFSFPVPAPPAKIVFNPDHAVLARVRKR